MAEKSGPLESTSDGLEEADWIELETPVWQQSGYIANYLNELAVSQTAPNAGMSVDVATGAALVNTTRYINSAKQTLAIEVAHATEDRYDLIVVERTLAAPNSTIDLKVVKGSNYAAGTAVPPDPTINSTVWQIVLATAFVEHQAVEILTVDIEDQRESTDCGAVYAPMGKFAIDPATGNMDANGKKIIAVADPTSDQDVDTKAARNAAIAAYAPGGILLARTVYTTGSGNHTTNAKTTKVLIRMIGGGGGSGGGKASANCMTAPGGTGAYLEKFATVTGSTPYAYVVGAAGIAGTDTPTDGGDGGDTTFTVGATTFTAGGGKKTSKATGGNLNAYDIAGLTAGVGGTSTNGDINITGNSKGVEGVVWVGAGNTTSGKVPAPAFGGQVYGFGGQGICAGAGSGVAGNAGGGGIIVIEEYQ